MKKTIINIFLILGLIIFCTYLLSLKTVTDVSKKQEENIEENVKKEEKMEKNNYVSYNGNLKVEKTNLLNQYGETIQLKGISSHGIQWYSNYINEANLKTLKNEWGSNVFRIAMYTDEGGYLTNPNLEEKVIEYVDMIIKQDMYVIIDWHILKDNNPMTNIDKAKVFFERMAKKYKNTPNVIFEICNEPNGNITWENDIKPYAEEIIKIIRKYSNNVIIVGTGNWSQDVDKAADNPLNYSNIVYACHFYAGTHTAWLRDKVNYALNKGIPIFVSEWGTSSADGNGGIYLEESKKWIDFLDEKNISWINWSLTDKNESSALLLTGTPNNDISDKYLTNSGKFVKEQMKK